MARFTQWWMRSVRTGYAHAQCSAMDGMPPERHPLRETRSIGMSQHMRRRGNTQHDSAVDAFFAILGKLRPFYDQIKHRQRAIRGGRHTLIE